MNQNRNSINILIAEKSEIIFQGLYRIVMESELSCSCLRAYSIEEAIKITQSKTVDIAILNPILAQGAMPHFHSLKAANPNLALMALLFSYFDPNLISEFACSININDNPKTIIDLINDNINKNIQNDFDASIALSEREIEVLKLLVKGNSNKEIADELFLSVHTVVSHRKNISQKTGIKSLAGLTIYAVVQKYISIDEYQK